jgi:hypothetical protein
MDSSMPKTPFFFLTCGKSLGLLDPAVATAKATAALAELDLRWEKAFHLGTIKIKYNSY